MTVVVLRSMWVIIYFNPISCSKFRLLSWLELRIRFNRYSMRSFQKALVRFNKLWIHFIFREFNWVSMFKIPSPYLQMESWARCLGGCFFPFQKKAYILSISFAIYFRIVYIWPVNHSFDKRIWFTISFYFSKRISLCSRYWFFLFCSNWSCRG